MKNTGYCLLLAFFIFSSCTDKNKESKTAVQDTSSSKDVVFKFNNEGPNVENGLYETRHKNGKIYMRGYYKNGKREGLWLSFYETGLPWSEGEYEDGKRNGKSVSYYENGKIRFSGTYKNDKKTGVWNFYDEDGKQVREIDFDKENP